MSFDLSTLSIWREERLAPLIFKPFELDQSFDYFEKVTGVAGQDVRLPIVETSPIIAFTDGCGFSQNATTAIKQVSINAPSQKVEAGYCLKSLKKYFTKQWLPDNTENPDTFTVLDTIVSDLLQKTARRNSMIMWIGDTSVAPYPTDFKAYNGILKQVISNIPAQQQNTLPSGQTITTTNVISVFDAVIASLPSSVLTQRPVLFCGTDVFRILVLALREKNYYHYQYDITSNPDTFTLKPLVYPGTNVVVVPTLGLNSDNVGSQPLQYKQRIIATYQGNIILGFNVSLDEVDIWYSQDADEVRVRYAYNCGVAAKFPELISEFHLTP